MKRVHTMPFGSRVMGTEGVLFQLWAPVANSVEVGLAATGEEMRFSAMTRGEEGCFSLLCREAQAGDHYRFRLDGTLLVPDPASRCQADGVHGASVVVDPATFMWQDSAWQGRRWEEAVLYELHVGTFTASGDYAGVMGKLDELAELGVTALELMPLADFPGRRSWGYDGVLLFAPARAYGPVEDLKSLIQAAHDRGLMVIADVVYNHFGPEGNYLHTYGREQFFSNRHRTPWGRALNFDGPQSHLVRDFYRHNALYWLEEFHLDGLRLDAVHAIKDSSSPHILEEIAVAARDGPGQERHIHLILENDDNEPRYLRRTATGPPCFFTCQWNDDIHHACHVVLTGEEDGYYQDYAVRPLAHLGRALAEGFAYQGEASPYRDGRRRGGTSRELPPTAFVSFLQNHDQVGNRALGERLICLSTDRRLRLAVALLCLAPAPPLLFMGEEYGARTPFFFFCDFSPELGRAVYEGRCREFAAFAEAAGHNSVRQGPDPNDEATFIRSRLQWPDTPDASAWRTFYRQLLSIRHQQVVPLLADLHGNCGSYQLLGPEALEVQWRLSRGGSIRVRVNFGIIPLADLPAQDGIIFYHGPHSHHPARLDTELPAEAIVWSVES